MNRLSVAASLSTALLLAACAGDPAMMSDKRPATPPGGLWEVTQAIAVEPMGTHQAPYLGQKLALYGNSAGDPAGRLCKAPVYQGYEAPPALVLGAKGEEQARPVLEVTCEGEPFGTYVGSADGALRTRVNAWLLTLARTDQAEPAPASPPPMPIAAMPAETPTVVPTTAPAPIAEPVKAAAKPTGTLVYLASYKNPETARMGFDRLTKHSAILANSAMVLKEVDLGAKGRWIRLFAEATDAAQGKALCAQLGKQLNGCGVGWAK